MPASRKLRALKRAQAEAQSAFDAASAKCTPAGPERIVAEKVLIEFRRSIKFLERNIAALDERRYHEGLCLQDVRSNAPAILLSDLERWKTEQVKTEASRN